MPYPTYRTKQFKIDINKIIGKLEKLGVTKKDISNLLAEFIPILRQTPDQHEKLTEALTTLGNSIYNLCVPLIFKGSGSEVTVEKAANYENSDAARKHSAASNVTDLINGVEDQENSLKYRNKFVAKLRPNKSPKTKLITAFTEIIQERSKQAAQSR